MVCFERLHRSLSYCLAVCCLASMVSGAQVSVASEDDPLEPINRATFEFNIQADKYLLRPVAQGYDAVTPTVVRRGVNNFFGNFLDANAALNAYLQGRVGFGWDNTLRVLANTTLGIFGLFDVATDMGIPRYQTDFGHTLALWGVPEGDYIVFPFLGPRTYRSGVGTFVDAYASPAGQINGQEAQWGLRGVELIDLRAGLLGTDRLISGDQYIFFRDAYLQRRASLVSDGQAVDSFSEFDDGWEDDDL